MKNLILGIITIGLFVSIVGCSKGDANPEFRIWNQRLTKANIQIQTSGGNTITINGVDTGQMTAYQSAAEGNITVTAGIQGESVSPTTTFFAAKNARYTVVIQTANPPTLGVIQP